MTDVWTQDGINLSNEEKKKKMLAKIVDSMDDIMGTGHEGEYVQKGDFDESDIFSEQFVTTAEDGKKRIWDMTKTRTVEEWADLLDRAIDVKPYDGMPFKWTDGNIYTYVAPVEDTSAKQQEPVRPGTTLQDLVNKIGGVRPDPRTDSQAKSTVDIDIERRPVERLEDRAPAKSKGKPGARKMSF